MPSELERAITAFRRDLLANERRAASAMVQAYGQSWVEISAQIAQIQRELASVNDPALVYRQRYLIALRQQVAQKLAEFASLAEASTLVTQRAAMMAAASNAMTLADIVSGGGTQAYFTRLPQEAIESLVGFASDGSPLNQLFAELFDYADDITDLFASGLAAGLNPREIAAQLRQAYGVPLVRALIIARTETLRAYREATWQSYQNNRDIISGWIWISAADRRSCVSCIAMHGSRHRLDEKLDGHPNCVIAGTMIDSPLILATSKRWFDGEVIEITTVNGNVLTVTKNHPILTDKGWIAAHLLTEGSNVISSRDSQRTIALVDPNHDSGPSLIEDIVESFERSGGMLSVSVPTATVDFHGDGGHGNVNIVGTNSLLDNGRQPARGQPFSEDSFTIGRMGLIPLFAKRTPFEVFDGAFHAADGFLSYGDASEVFIPGSLGGQQLIGGSLVADFYAKFNQAQANDIATDPVIDRNLIFGFSREIPFGDFRNWQFDALANYGDSALSQVPIQGSFADAVLFSNDAGRNSADVCVDSVVKIIVKQFAGHVYNLQTSTGWYIANGIVTHNCRCVQVPIVKGFPLPDIAPGAERFKALSDDDQLRVMGPAMLAAWRNGMIDLTPTGEHSVVGRRRSKRWGTMRYAKSLRAILGDELAKQFLRAAIA